MNSELFSKLKRFFLFLGPFMYIFGRLAKRDVALFWEWLWCQIQCYQLPLSFLMYLVVRCCNCHSQIKHISFPTSFLRQYYYICSGHHEVYIIQPCWLPGYVRKALAYTAGKASKYWVFLVRSFAHLDWIRTDTPYLSISPYSVRMRENMDQKKLRIWTLHAVLVIATLLL